MMKPSRFYQIGGTCLLMMLLLGSGFAALAGCASEDTPDAEVQADTLVAEQVPVDPIASGRATYEAYCASCHGPAAKGDGPVAAELSAQPADLTQLSAKYEGAFPVDTLYQIIDGRKMVEAHGTRDMPVWGNIWSEGEEGEPVPEEVVERRINELIEYLRSIQEEGAEG